MLVSICMASGGSIDYRTASCLIDLLVKAKVNKFVGIFAGGYKPLSLTLGYKQAKEHNATHILFIDSDMIFPPEALDILAKQDKDIIGANYNQRKLPLQSTIKLADEKGNLIAGDLTKYKETFECYALGFGCMLVKMEVFDKIERPFFNAPMDEKDNFKTDDVYFCEKAQKAGYKIYCDPTLVVKHVGDYLY